MRNPSERYLVVGVFLILVCIVPARWSWGQTDGERIGTVLTVDGVAEVQARGAPEWERLRFRDPIFLNDTVRTGADSKLKVLLNDETILTLVENGEVQFNEFFLSQNQRRTVFGLLLGKIRVLTTSIFGTDSATEVHTPNSITGVRGSELIVQYVGADQKTTLLCVSVSGPQQDHCYMQDPQNPSQFLNVPAGRLAEQIGTVFPDTTRAPTPAERQALTRGVTVTEQINQEVLPTKDQPAPAPLRTGELPPELPPLVVATAAPQPTLEPPSLEALAEPAVGGDLGSEDLLTSDTTPTAEDLIEESLRLDVGIKFPGR